MRLTIKGKDAVIVNKKMSIDDAMLILEEKLCKQGYFWDENA